MQTHKLNWRPRDQSKTEADTLADVEADIDINTLTKFKLRHWCIRRLTSFRKCRPKVLLTH